MASAMLLSGLPTQIVARLPRSTLQHFAGPLVLGPFSGAYAFASTPPRELVTPGPRKHRRHLYVPLLDVTKRQEDYLECSIVVSGAAQDLPENGTIRRNSTFQLLYQRPHHSATLGELWANSVKVSSLP